MKKIQYSEFLAAQHLYDILVDPVYAMDVEETLTYWNRPFLQYTALSRRELEAGVKVPDVLRLDLSEIGSLFAKCVEEKRTVVWREVWARGREDEPLSLACSYTPLWEGDQVVGAVATFKDLTVEEEIHNKYKVLWEREREARRRAETLSDDLARSHAELEDAYAQLQVLDKMKASFIDLVSHELRTPITGVLATAQIFEHPERLEKAQIKQLSEILRTQSRKLTNMVNDILDLSTMVGGKMHYHLVQANANTLVEKVVREQAGGFHGKGVVLALDLAESGTSVRFDAEKIDRVLKSMLDNALKHTPHGGKVVVATRRIGDGVQVTVRDNGEGIPRDGLARVFATFEQVEDVLHHQDGRGLGMAVAKGIVEQGHGGRIWCESEGAGKGAAFHFVLPAQQQVVETYGDTV